MSTNTKDLLSYSRRKALCSFLRILLISGLQKIVRERGATPKYEEVYFDNTLMINFFHKAKKFLY
jgi:hypothetical protein